MNTDGKIYIVITDKMPGSPGSPEGEGKGEGARKSESGMVAHWARQRLLGEAKSQANSWLSYGLNNIGNFTGNYTAQAEVQAGMTMLSRVSGIGASTLAGFRVAGPWGAVIGAGLSILNSFTQDIQRHNLRMLEQRKTNYAIAQLRERSAMNPYVDWGRGTEN